MVTRWMVTKAVRASDLPASSRLVMLTLADVAEVGTAEIPPRFTPSLSVLARETGLSSSTVKDHLAALEAAGWLGRTRPDAAAQWRGERTRYRLLVAESMAVPEMAQCGPDDGQEVGRSSAYPVEGVGRSLAQGGPMVGPGVGRSPAGGRPVSGHQETDLSDLSQISSDQTLVSEAKAPDPEPPRADVEKICRHLADRIAANGSKRPRITKTWRDEARKLIDLDGKTVEQVVRAIDWCQNDRFWRKNIMSMPTLREKYDRIRLDAQGKTEQANGRSNGANRHIDQLPPAERAARNPFATAVHASQVAAGGAS